MSPQKPCAKCSASIDHRVKSGLCDPCSRKPCIDCQKPTSPRNKTGRCSPCSLAHAIAQPGFEEKRVAGIRRKFTDPVFAHKIRMCAKRMGIESAKDPELRARRVAWGKHVYATVLSRPDVVEKTLKAVREKAGKTQSETKLAWCPPEYREEYLRLLRKSKLKKVEAVEIILAQVKADLARLSPFERQQRALEKGAKLVANDRGPTFGEALKTA